MDTIGSFSDLIGSLEGGAFDNDVTAALHAMMTRLRRDHRDGGGKPAGKITLSIAFKLEDGTIGTTQSFAVDPPVARTPDRFFVSPTGTLSQHPPQEVIPLKGVVR